MRSKAPASRASSGATAKTSHRRPPGAAENAAAGAVEHALDERDELVLVPERLLDEILGALLHRRHRHRHVAVAGDEDDRQRRAALDQAVPQLQAAMPSMRMSAIRQATRAGRSATGRTRLSRSRRRGGLPSKILSESAPPRRRRRRRTVPRLGIRASWAGLHESRLMEEGSGPRCGRLRPAA